MEKWKNLRKEVQCFFLFSGSAAVMLVIGGIDSLMDAGFVGFILGTLSFLLIGMIYGALATVCYMIANAVAPEKTKKILEKLTSEPEEDEFTEED